VIRNVRAADPAAPPTSPRRRPSRLGGLVVTARPGQWVKNVLVFAAPVAAGVVASVSQDLRVVAAFVLFCAASSGIYLVNDALDAESDRAHPRKRRRPVASGRVPARLALVAGLVLSVGTSLAAFSVGWRLAVVLAVYVTVQLAYCVWLKHLAVYDIVCVASGFVLRAIAGGVAAHVPVSQWFLIVATFGSLLMVTGKRLAEMIDLGGAGGEHRRTLQLYSTTFLRTVLAISAGAAMIGYSLWAFDLQTALRHHSDPIWFELSIVPMLIALLRYSYFVDGGRGARPEALVLSDRSLQLLGLAWVVLFAVGVYG